MLRYLWVRICIYLLPAVLIAYGDDKIPVEVFSDSNKQKNFQTIIFFLGLAATLAIFPYIVERYKRHIDYQSDVIKRFLKSLKATITNELEIAFNEPDLNLNIRFFFEKRDILSRFIKLFTNKIYFKIYNLDGIFEDEVESLEFRVYPNPQGLIGKCYNDRRIWYDFFLQDNHTTPVYNLTKSQQQKTEYCEFAVACPIFNEDDTIDLIIAFDSGKKLKQPINDDWKDKIKEACRIVQLMKKLIKHKIKNYELS